MSESKDDPDPPPKKTPPAFGGIPDGNEGLATGRASRSHRKWIGRSR